MLIKQVVLHVEDNDHIAFIFQEAMRETAQLLTLFRVCDGEEALAFLHQAAPYQQAARPDLIFLDLNMPKVDGWGVLSAMQQDESLSDIPVAVLSTSSAKSDKVRAHSLGARGYLTKPLDFEDFVQQLSDACLSFLNNDSSI